MRSTTEYFSTSRLSVGRSRELKDHEMYIMPIYVVRFQMSPQHDHHQYQRHCRIAIAKAVRRQQLTFRKSNDPCTPPILINFIFPQTHRSINLILPVPVPSQIFCPAPPSETPTKTGLIGKSRTSLSPRGQSTARTS